jgi:hypothetical protein
MAEQNGEFTLISNTPSSLNPTILWHTEDTLSAGGTYRFKVSSVNLIGESELTDQVLVIAADLPESPTNPPSVILITETSISITVDEIPESSNGGSPITGYIIQIDDGHGGEFTTV